MGGGTEEGFTYILESPEENYNITLGFLKYKDLDSELGKQPSLADMIALIQRKGLENEFFDFCQWEADVLWYDMEDELWDYYMLYWDDDFYARYEKDNYSKHWHPHLAPPSF